MSLTFGLFTQVNDPGPQGPLVIIQERKQEVLKVVTLSENSRNIKAYPYTVNPVLRVHSRGHTKTGCLKQVTP